MKLVDAFFKMVEVAIIAFLCIAVIGVIILIPACISINNKIDRCDDPSSGTYIWDDAARKAACDRNRS